ncbi:MAG: hypothetical protein HYX92_17935 [Chloroflexi bacterium]|nr:hypothetical protein [Chloroflexota bacterium]
MTQRAPIEEATFAYEDDCQAINNLFYEQGWTDGLPIVPPTDEAVQAMLSGANMKPSEVLGKIPPTWDEATAEKVAVNAVMAGCQPEYLPVVIAAVEAIAEPEFNAHGMQATTHPAAPLIIVNGPIRKQLDINCRYNLFGPGWRANATIGRAIRLVLLNIGGGVPGVLDRCTIGMPSKYTYCIGENEEESPWEPLHVERGYAKSDNVVTALAADGPRDVLERSSTTAVGVLTTLTRSIGAIGSPNSLIYGVNLLVICPEHAQSIAREGYTKEMVRQFVFENGWVPADWFGPEVGPWRRQQLEQKGIAIKDDRIPMSEKPEDIMIVVAGGAGKHSGYIGTLTQARPVSKPIRMK